jgi:hypothetical protein
MQIKDNFDKLVLCINNLRELMVSAGITKGSHSSDTLKSREDLDKLSIQLQLQNRP